MRQWYEDLKKGWRLDHGAPREIGSLVLADGVSIEWLVSELRYLFLRPGSLDRLAQDPRFMEISTAEFWRCFPGDGKRHEGAWLRDAFASHLLALLRAEAEAAKNTKQFI